MSNREMELSPLRAKMNENSIDHINRQGPLLSSHRSRYEIERWNEERKTDAKNTVGRKARRTRRGRESALAGEKAGTDDGTWKDGGGREGGAAVEGGDEGGEGRKEGENKREGRRENEGRKIIRPTCIQTERRSLYVIGWNRDGTGRTGTRPPRRRKLPCCMRPPVPSRPIKL